MIVGKSHRLLITFLILVIAVVFFAPSTDLEPTALRASQAASALQLALVYAALTLNALFFLACLSMVREFSDSHLASHDDLITLNCSRLC